MWVILSNNKEVVQFLAFSIRDLEFEPVMISELVDCMFGFLQGGGILQKYCWDLSRGGNFHITTPIFLIKSYRFDFPAGETSTKKSKAENTNAPCENFHIYSNSCIQVALSKATFKKCS